VSIQGGGWLGELGPGRWRYRAVPLRAVRTFLKRFRKTFRLPFAPVRGKKPVLLELVLEWIACFELWIFFSALSIFAAYSAQAEACATGAW